MLSFSVNPLLIFRKKPEIWYTIKSGNYNDPSIWTSAGRRFNRLIPRSIDTIVVAHNLTINQNVTITNVYGQSGNIVFDNTARTLDCLGDCQIYGVLNMAGSGATGHNLILRGVNNFIEPTTFVTGTGSTVTYSNLSVLKTPLLNFNFFIFSLVNQQIFSTGNFTFNKLRYDGNIYFQNSIIDVINNHNANDSGNGVGFLILENSTIFFRNVNEIYILNTINSNIEFFNDFTSKTSNVNNLCNNGGVCYFRSNLSIFDRFGYSNSFNIYNGIIDNNVIVINNRTNSQFLNIFSINGNNVNSRFDNRHWLSIDSATSIMLTGQFYTNQANNIVNYSRSGNQDVRVPDDGQYRTLIFSGSGAKKLLGNITCNEFRLEGTATINGNGFTLTILNDYIISPSIEQLLPSSSVVIHSSRLIMRSNAGRILSSNMNCTDYISDQNNAPITFNGFQIISSGIAFYTGNQSQSIWASANIIYNNLTIGGTASPNNKTLQGNVSVVGTYTETGNAVRVNNGFTFGNY